MNLLIFWIIIFIEVVLGLGLAWSYVNPQKGVWPPPGKHTWQFYFAWVLLVAFLICTFILGVLNWNTFIFAHWSRFFIGSLPIAEGCIYIMVGNKALGAQATDGLKVKFVTDGIYKYTRNPQYMGGCLLIIGYTIICNSILHYIIGILAIILLVFTPFVEEKWLQEKFGKQYKRYCSNVPRFINGRFWHGIMASW